MKFTCSNCNAEIKSENINISTDLAKCDQCGSIHKVSDLSISLEEKDLSPPVGSKIVLEKGLSGGVKFTYPKRGFSASLIPLLIFAIFWLGFVTFWTWGAAQGSIFFALFSIPFWLVGLSMVAGLINSANEIQVLTLDQHQLTLIRHRPIRPKSFEIDLKDIQAVKMKVMKMNPLSVFSNFGNMMKMQKSSGGALEVPAIITGQKTEYFFDGANDAEQEWIVKILASLVKRS